MHTRRTTSRTGRRRSRRTCRTSYADIRNLRSYRETHSARTNCRSYYDVAFPPSFLTHSRLREPDREVGGRECWSARARTGGSGRRSRNGHGQRTTHMTRTVRPGVERHLDSFRTEETPVAGVGDPRKGLVDREGSGTDVGVPPGSRGGEDRWVDLSNSRSTGSTTRTRSRRR